MMEVDVDLIPDGTIDAGESRFLFDDSVYETLHSLPNYDVTSDEHFLMIKGAPPKQINVIVNWSEELKRLAPSGKR
jgi:hypothetical protein